MSKVLEKQNGNAAEASGLHPESNGSASDGASVLYGSPGSKVKWAEMHRPLTLFRVIRGLLCLLVLLSTAFVGLITLSPVTILLLRLFNLHYSRQITAFFFGHWLSMWPFLFEKINKTKVVFAGDKVPCEERVMVMCNHRTEVDWMYIWNLATRKGKIGYCKYVLKSSVRNLPVFGWAFHAFEFLFLDRRWEVDSPVIKSYVESFKDPADPLWLILFPEGTDFTEEKRLKGNLFAKERGYPELINVLQPRTRGFVACFSHLHTSLSAVYDLTIGYRFQCPSFIDNLFGINPAEVHIHVRRVPVSDIPISDEGASNWLYGTFLKKDQLLAEFSKHGCFPDTAGCQEPLDSATCMRNFLCFTVLSYLILRYALFASKWFKLYVAFSCVVLAACTFCSFLPSPRLGSLWIRKSA